MPTDKSNLRQVLLAKREQWSKNENYQERSSLLCDCLSNYLDERYPLAKVMAFYWPIRAEIDVTAVAQAWQSQDPTRVLALPVVKGPAFSLEFCIWYSGCDMQLGAYRIPEPQTKAVRPDIVLVPCLGFTAKGFRLGYGGGYYDRTIAYFRNQPVAAPKWIGVAWSWSVCEFEPESWDWPLDAVVTDQVIIE